MFKLIGIYIFVNAHMMEKEKKKKKGKSRDEIGSQYYPVKIDGGENWCRWFNVQSSVPRAFQSFEGYFFYYLFTSF